MSTIEKLETFLEKLKSLNYSFLCQENAKEAEIYKEDAVASLEAYVELAAMDEESELNGDENDNEND